MKAFVDEMFVILPFEKDFYKKYDFPVHFIGHPLLDVVKDFFPTPGFRQKNGLSDKPIIALLPGSRKQEIRAMLAEMLATIPCFSNYQFVIAGAPSMTRDFYEEIISSLPATISKSVHLIENQTYDLFAQAEAALVTSGTATLEAALFRVPQVVCYKGSWISYAIAKRIIKVKFISLVNLILDREVVKELIQDEMTAENLRAELALILEENGRQKLKDAYNKLANMLGNSGAVNRAAKIMATKIQT
ncbi:MAG: lipid-A-disaccharide synthase [Saprospiraceae bacterium]